MRTGSVLCSYKPLPIVFNPQHDPAGSVAEQNGDRTGTRMLPHVTQGFLHHPIQLVLNVFWELLCPSTQAKRAINSAITRKTFGKLSQGVDQASAFERLWPQTQE